MKIAGLTGGIGSGKSTVARILSELGAYIIDADELARRVVEPGKPAFEEIRERFGEAVIGPAQNLDRKKLAEIIFDDPGKKELLEKITHPRIGEEIMRELQKAREQGFGLAVIDAALLLESPLGDWARPVILVVADPAVRVSRVCQRDRVCEEEVGSRIRNQSPDSEKMKKSDYVIDNNCDLEELKKRVTEVYHRLPGE